MFFDLTHFRELGQNYRNILVWFLVQIKTLKFASEINWPLQMNIEIKAKAFPKQYNYKCPIHLLVQNSFFYGQYCFNGIMSSSDLTTNLQILFSPIFFTNMSQFWTSEKEKEILSSKNHLINKDFYFLSFEQFKKS